MTAVGGRNSQNTTIASPGFFGVVAAGLGAAIRGAGAAVDLLGYRREESVPSDAVVLCGAEPPSIVVAKQPEPIPGRGSDKEIPVMPETTAEVIDLDRSTFKTLRVPVAKVQLPGQSWAGRDRVEMAPLVGGAQLPGAFHNYDRFMHLMYFVMMCPLNSNNAGQINTADRRTVCNGRLGWDRERLRNGSKSACAFSQNLAANGEV